MDTLLELDPGRAHSLAAHGPVMLSVRAGRIWLTRRGDPADHFLASGDDCLLGGNDGVVVEADGDGPVRIALVRPSPRSGWWNGVRAALWWRLAVLALSHLCASKPKWPREVVELDEHALQDIGAPAGVRSAARLHREASRLRSAQLRLALAS